MTETKKSKNQKIAFLAINTKEAKDAQKKLVKAYGNVSPQRADVIVALGGDGFMLDTQHKYSKKNIPVYGMNKGSVGFLMNNYKEKNLYKRLNEARAVNIHPLIMKVVDKNKKTHTASAFNEVSLFRQSHQTANLRIIVDGKERLDSLSCDGILVATPQGSTAYNFSAYGPIIPLSAPLLALTPICAFRPRAWRGALVPNTSKIQIINAEPNKRPISAVADKKEIRSAVKVFVEENKKAHGILLFDPEHSWEERILQEQFRY